MLLHSEPKFGLVDTLSKNHMFLDFLERRTIKKKKCSCPINSAVLIVSIRTHPTPSLINSVGMPFGILQVTWGVLYIKSAWKKMWQSDNSSICFITNLGNMDPEVRNTHMSQLPEDSFGLSLSDRIGLILGLIFALSMQTQLNSKLQIWAVNK